MVLINNGAINKEIKAKNLHRQKNQEERKELVNSGIGKSLHLF